VYDPVSIESAAHVLSVRTGCEFKGVEKRSGQSPFRSNVINTPWYSLLVIVDLEDLVGDVLEKWESFSR